MRKIQCGDSFQRMNYLYQFCWIIKNGKNKDFNPVMSYVSEIGFLCFIEEGVKISKHVVEKNAALSSYYNNLMINLAKKSVLKMHPDIKRQVCKKCKCMLVNNVSAKMKIKSKKKSKTIQWTCNTCNTKKCFPADKNNQKTLWLEREEAVVKEQTDNNNEK